MRAVLALLLLLLIAPATAGAATVRVVRSEESSGGFRDDYTEVVKSVRIVAGKGERNRITFRRGKQKGRWLVIDRGKRPTVKRGCKRRGRRTAVCTLGKHDRRRVRAFLGDRSDRLRVVGKPRMESIYVRAGAGNDTIAIGRTRGEVHGGDGKDRLTGSPGRDVLHGGAGADRIAGGAGADTIYDGTGKDRVAGGRGGDRFVASEGAFPADDRYDGGPGRDVVDYGSRNDPVTVTLGATGGVAGERDVLRRVEGVSGTAFADVLTGDDGPNTISGYSGADRIDGRGGDDGLAGSGSGTVIACGAGADTVGAGSQTLLEGDCERVYDSDAHTPVPAQITGSSRESLSVVQECRVPYVNRALTRIRVPLGGRPWSFGEPDALLASGVTEVREGTACRVGLEPTELGRETFAPGQQVVVALTEGRPRYLVRLTVPAG